MMKLEKKHIAILLFVAIGIIIIIIAVMFLLGKGYKTPEPQPNTDNTLEGTAGPLTTTEEIAKNMRIDEWDGLYVYRDDEQDKFKQQVAQFLVDNKFTFPAHAPTVVIVVSAVETNDSTTFFFWIEIPYHYTIIKVDYNIDEDTTKFAIEKDETIIKKVQKLPPDLADYDDPSVEDVKPEIDIDNEQVISQLLSPDNMKVFKDTLEEFLQEKDEFRRFFTVDENAIGNGEEFIDFPLLFRTPEQVWGKEDYSLYIVMYKSGYCKISIIPLATKTKKE